MFGWLAKMLIKTPVVGSSCACCESKKERLKKMQQAIETGEIEIDEAEDLNFSSGSYSAKCSGDGTCRSQEYHAKILGDLSNGGSVQEHSENCTDCGCKKN